MIKLENTKTYGWEAAIRGMRNPMNSWEKSDTLFYDYGSSDGINDINYYHTLTGKREKLLAEEDYVVEGCCDNVGQNDHKLMMNLAKAGSVDAKYRRMIVVTVDITAPLYWWKEFDTYKIGTVANSCSTMHKIQAKEFTLEDFSCEHLFKAPEFEDIPNFKPEYLKSLEAFQDALDAKTDLYNKGEISREEYDAFYRENKPSTEIDLESKWHHENGAWEAFGAWDDDCNEWVEYKYALDCVETTIRALNYYRERFLETKDKRYWWQMIQLLPSSYNQRRTVMLNYEVLAGIYPKRKDHKLDEWHDFCEWIRELPYSEIITLEEETE